MRRLEELLNARIDRTLTPTEAAELDVLLERDEDARRLAADYTRLAQILDDTNEPDAPAGLVRDVMHRVEALSQRPARTAGRVWTPRVIRGGGLVMAKKAMIGVAAAAAAGLVVFAITGYPHITGNGTAGAVGAAKRAQAPQIAAADVVTGDPAVQQFLQSETFDQLRKDPNAVKLLSDTSFRSAMRSADMRAALASDEIHAALKQASIQSAFEDAAMQAALADANVRAALAKADVRAALARADIHAAMKAADLESAMSKAAFEAALQKAGVRAAFADAALQAAMARADIRAALANDAVRAALADANMQAALRSSDLAAAIRDAAFESALKSASFESALHSESAYRGK